MKIIIGGPPHSGKSCLRYGLKESIKAQTGSPYPYVITACPDGEGAWFQETHNKDPELAKRLRLPYKSGFSKEKVEMWAEWVNNCSEPLTFIDIGGIPDAKNQEICKSATHAILVYGNKELLPEWLEFCKKLNLRIIAIIYSDLNKNDDVPLSLGSDNIYRGTVHHLERGDLSIKDRPTIAELAKILTQIGIKKREPNMEVYKIDLEDNNILQLCMGDVPAQNDVLVQTVEKKLDELIAAKKIYGGEIIKINGPATLPIAFVLAHKLNHLYEAVAMYDPKLSKYVIVITHGPKYRVGDLVD